MPTTAIVCGVLLILVGIAGTVAAISNGASFGTALIPIYIGIIFVLLGVFARMKDNLRKHLMHAALLIAILGVIGGFFSPGIKGLITTGKIGDMTSFSAQAAMALICLGFLILGVKSFIAARRSGAV